MKEIIYKCDNCGKILSQGGEGVKHISINFGDRNSGWVNDSPNWIGELSNFTWATNSYNDNETIISSPDSEGTVEELSRKRYRWRHTKVVKGIKQFCDGKCLGEYFDKMIKKTTGKGRKK